METETPKHKILNNALVTTNEVVSSICKHRVNQAPHIHNTETAQDNRIILFKGSKLENQHTRKTLGTLSWIYKTSDYLMVIGPGSPCWSYQSQDLQPAKTEQCRDAHSSAEMQFIRLLLWLGRLTSDSVTATS